MAEPIGAAQPFVAGPPGPVELVLAAAADAALHWALPDPEVVRIGINGVFRCGDVILRVARPTAPAAASIDLAVNLLERGIRVPRPWSTHAVEPSSGLWVTAWERIDHDPSLPVDWRQVGEMVALVHAIDPADLPDTYPLPWCAGFPWWHFDDLLATASDLIDDTALAAIGACVARNRWALDPAQTRSPVVCHGDVHPGNVLVDGDGPVLIDWDLLCWGPPGWDHAPLMTWEHRWDAAPGTYAAFAAGAGTNGRSDPTAIALSELRLVAATFGRARAAITDPNAAEELERRLRWWRGDPEAPRWNPM